MSEELYARLLSLERRVQYLETIETPSTTVSIPIQAVTVKAVNYTLTATDSVVVFTITGLTATLPAATGSGQTYRIIYVAASGSLTIDGDGADTIKGNATQTLYSGEDLIVTDYLTGAWA